VTLKTLILQYNNIGAEGALALSNNSTLKELDLHNNNIGADGARALSFNQTLQHLILTYNAGIPTDVMDLVTDRLCVNRGVDKWVAKWLGAATNIPAPPHVQARAVMLAFGDELAGRREFAAAYLMPLAEAALLRELFF
jgi:hypothetical protein